jgi:predicted esterase
MRTRPSILRRLNRATCFARWTALALVASHASAAEIPKGRVLEHVACVADPKQTYALYIPTTFDPSRKWPVLFCFDPGARGKVPVERFQAAAEKFGWLVAGSNNSRNGPWDANATAINAMVTDLDRHLPLDRKQFYAAGLSGGARVACQLGMTGMLQGVIGCSAAFAGSETPAKVPYAFFGTAGVTDFNYRELRRVDRELEERRLVHRVMFFEGGHEWLPPALAMDALAWFQLHAMRIGARAKDAAWVQEQFEGRRALVPAGPVLDQQRALKSLAADFKGLVDTAGVEKKASELAASREVRDALKAERAAERAEQTVSDNLLAAVSEGYVASVRKTVVELQAKARGTGPDRIMATRVLQGVASTCSEAAREALRNSDYAEASSFLEMAALLRPERPQTHYDLARARAALGDRKRAIAALQQAVAAGFNDANRVRDEKAFDRIRHDAEFVAVVSALK